MKTLKTWFAGMVATAAVALMATGFAAAEQQGDDATLRGGASDTLQVDVEIGPEGFEPTEFTVLRDQPVRIVFTRTTEATCAKKIHIPDFGIEATTVPLNEAVAVDVLPVEDGTFSFACAMEMMKGAILVNTE